MGLGVNSFTLFCWWNMWLKSQEICHRHTRLCSILFAFNINFSKWYSTNYLLSHREWKQINIKDLFFHLHLAILFLSFFIFVSFLLFCPLPLLLLFITFCSPLLSLSLSLSLSLVFLPWCHPLACVRYRTLYHKQRHTLFMWHDSFQLEQTYTKRKG